MESLLAVSLTLLMCQVARAGEYCRGYFDNRLKHHNGFYCEHFCCGKPTHKYCCNVISFRYDGRGDNPQSVDVTSWNSTFWIMVGCILGTVVLIGSVMLLVFCVCCKHDTTHRALTERRCSTTQNMSTSQMAGEMSSKARPLEPRSDSHYTPVKTNDMSPSPPLSPIKDIFME